MPVRAQAPPPAPAPTADAAVASALRTAERDNKRVLIEWTADWCGWCKKLDACFKSERPIAKMLKDEYVIVHVNVGRFDTNLELAKRFDAQFKQQGIPYLTVLTADGEVVVNQETGSLEIGSDHDPERVFSFLKVNTAPKRDAKAWMARALARSAAENKPVFVHFGAPWCGWCHTFEAWLAQPEVAAIIDAHLIEIKIDTQQDIGGEALMLECTSGKQHGIPFSAIYDAKGKVITRSLNADGANIGCPWTKKERAAFAAFLKRATAGLSDEEILTLSESLRAFKKNEEQKRKDN